MKRLILESRDGYHRVCVEDGGDRRVFVEELHPTPIVDLWKECDDPPSHLLLEAVSRLAEENRALRNIAEACCNATDGGCSPGVSVEFLKGLPSEVGALRRDRDLFKSRCEHLAAKLRSRGAT